MSLILILVYWILVPVLVGLVVMALWRRARTYFQRAAVVVLGVTTFSGFFWIAEGEKFFLDKQVRELCAKVGGVKLYETVKLTPALLDKAGRIWIPDKAQAKPLDEYCYETDTRYYRTGNPEMSRVQHRIIRRSDGKVMGELIRYVRRGGELPGPWHGSSFMCPDPVKASNFESSVFVKRDKE